MRKKFPDVDMSAAGKPGEYRDVYFSIVPVIMPTQSRVGSQARQTIARTV
jgi:hypothetical protein